jgi:CRP-like cAMP-binding protein
MTPHELLRLHPFLGVLTGAETQELLKRAVTKHVAADTVVFRKDDPGDGLYGVLAGRVLIVAESADGRELILNQHDAGEFFGEVALLDGEGRSAAAKTREASDLVFLGRGEFLAFLSQRPEAMLRIMALLCARLRRATSLVEDAAFLNVSSRLAKQLIALMGRGDSGKPAAGGPTLRMSQKELAQRLGVTREFVSKQLAIWREAGIVELGRRHLTVRDERALEQLIATGRPVSR